MKEERSEGKGREGGREESREARREGRSSKRKVKRERGRNISRWHCVGRRHRLDFENVILFEHPMLKGKDKGGPCMSSGM